MADDIAKLPDALQIARRAMMISHQNIVFSLLVLAVLIPAAMLGFLSVAQAVVVHEGSELLAVANGLRAGR
jgi:Cd2+/Zn2+-exporting ATPase